MTTLPVDIADQLQKAQHAADGLGKEVQEMLNLLQASGIDSLSHLERAQAFLAVAHAVQAMYKLHVKVSGRDPSTMEMVIKEDKRLQVYTKKVNKAVTAEILKHSRPTLSLNVAAANRFIEAAIPEQLTAEQRAALHAATQTHKRKAEELATGQAQRKGKQGKKGMADTGGLGPRGAKEAAVAFLEQLKANRQTETVGLGVPPKPDMVEAEEADPGALSEAS